MEEKPEKHPQTPKSHYTNDSDDDLDWQDMPTVASYDVYNDKNEKIVIRKEDFNEEYNKRTTYHKEEEENKAESKYGYTRVTAAEDDDLKDEIDESTDFLFDEDEFRRNPLSQLETTKKMLNDSQRIAYVGLCKLAMIEMATDLAQLHGSFKIARKLSDAQGSMARWAQLMIMRLYTHMDISPEEQKMIELLSKHGIQPGDLAPSLMKSAKVDNPFFDKTKPATSEDGETLHPQSTHGSRAEIDDLHYENPDTYRNDKTIEIDVRWTMLCDLFLVLLSDSIYDSRSRTLMMHVGKYLEVTEMEITQFEKKVTDALEIDEASNQTWRETDIMEERRKKALKKKYMYVGLATIGGGLVLGLSAGLLAPVIGAGLAAGLSTIGISGTAGFLAGAGGTAVVTTTGVAVGSKIGLSGMNRRMGHVRTFEFRPLHNNKRVNLIVTVSGWLVGKEDDVRLPFSTVDPIMGDVYSLLWEPEMLTSMGQTINILATEILTQSVQQILGSTILVALMASIQLPMALSKLGYLLDNPWNVSLDRAWSSGLILADTLIRRNLGVRPVTLAGFSLGARVIYSCLVELARQGMHGLVQDVFIFGAPIVIKKDQIKLARSVVSGRFVNGYSKKDWILGYLFRATSGGLGHISGLAPINDIPGVENVDLTDEVEGHMGYRAVMPRLLMGLGWEVTSEEFEEIEDPDPDQHRERQRQLIQEFDDARKQMEREAAAVGSEADGRPVSKAAKSRAKKKKSLFNWLKPKEKELWEMYDRELEHTHKKEEEAAAAAAAELPGRRASSSVSTAASSGASTPASRGTQSSDVIFDVDAIRKELEELGRTGADINSGAAKPKDFDFAKDEVPTKARQNSKPKAVQMEFDDGYGDDDRSYDEDPFSDDNSVRNGHAAHGLPHTASSPALAAATAGSSGSVSGTLSQLRNGRAATLSAASVPLPAAPPKSTVHKHASAVSRGPSPRVAATAPPPPQPQHQPPAEPSPWADDAGGKARRTTNPFGYSDDEDGDLGAPPPRQSQPQPQTHGRQDSADLALGNGGARQPANGHGAAAEKMTFYDEDDEYGGGASGGGGNIHMSFD